MRKTARAIVVKDNQLLLMFRDKFGNKYYTLPGGGVEMGEEIIDTLFREIAEETTIKIANPRLTYVEHAGNMYGDQYIYVCDYVSGEPALDPESEELLLEKIAHNIHRPVWFDISKFNGLRFLSEELKQKILAGFERGWPAEVEEFTSTRNV